MIDKPILQRLRDQVSYSSFGRDSVDLKLANACAAYGAGQCATGEWLDYPQYQPEIDGIYFVEMEKPKNWFVTDQDRFDIFEWSDSYAHTWAYHNVKRFARINL